MGHAVTCAGARTQWNLHLHRGVSPAMIKFLLFLTLFFSADVRAEGSSMRSMAPTEVIDKLEPPPVPEDWAVVPSPFADVYAARETNRRPCVCLATSQVLFLGWPKNSTCR